MGQWDSPRSGADWRGPPRQCADTQGRKPRPSGDSEAVPVRGPATSDLRVEVDMGAKLRLYRGMELILRAARGAYDRAG